MPITVPILSSYSIASIWLWTHMKRPHLTVPAASNRHPAPCLLKGPASCQLRHVINCANSDPKNSSRKTYSNTSTASKRRKQDYSPLAPDVANKNCGCTKKTMAV